MLLAVRATFDDRVRQTGSAFFINRTVRAFGKQWQVALTSKSLLTRTCLGQASAQVPKPSLLEVTLAYSSEMGETERLTWTLTSSMSVGNQQHGWYRLATDPQSRHAYLYIEKDAIPSRASIYNVRLCSLLEASSEFGRPSPGQPSAGHPILVFGHGEDQVEWKPEPCFVEGSSRDGTIRLSSSSLPKDHDRGGLVCTSSGNQAIAIHLGRSDSLQPNDLALLITQLMLDGMLLATPKDTEGGQTTSISTHQTTGPVNIQQQAQSGATQNMTVETNTYNTSISGKNVTVIYNTGNFHVGHPGSSSSVNKDDAMSLAPRSPAWEQVIRPDFGKLLDLDCSKFANMLYQEDIITSRELRLVMKKSDDSSMDHSDVTRWLVACALYNKPERYILKFIEVLEKNEDRGVRDVGQSLRKRYEEQRKVATSPPRES